eukprot:CAMPEP_0171629606 /NCGR_PEP_ID=MMETSP0990-20121206/22303_1 /TAXON_ID=483369 /ORGANISM="non described non described, Strain CCMP2098" /LENGTH=202 /DNA_ID=CAMNT_0012198355 /DNA_START=28 /DNA_END=636 /DNA_ORIENTATION=+
MAAALFRGALQKSISRAVRTPMHARNVAKSFTSTPVLLSDGGGGDFRLGGGRRRGGRQTAVATSRRPPPPAGVKDAWTQVKDDASGQHYWWNKETDEVTALGEPKPGGEVGQPQPESGGMMSGLGRVVAEGAAFGVGSSIARMAMGSVFEAFGGDADAFSGGDEGDSSADGGDSSDGGGFEDTSGSDDWGDQGDDWSDEDDI